jgi:ribose 5-phosphate isomerase B
MTIYLASDHVGFHMKERLKQWLSKREHRVVDVGPQELDPADDYPDYAIPLARRVVAANGRGILVCANGVGVCMAANKVAGVRAGIAWSVEAAKTARADDNTNILCLPARIRIMDAPEKIVAAWTAAKFSGAARHRRRLKKVAALDQ